MAVFLVYSAVVAAAQQPLSLDEVLRQAESANLELRAARQQRAMALAGLTTARQFPNPTVAFSASRDLPHQTVSYDQPFELGGKRAKRIAVAREEQALTETEIGILARQVRRRAREAFFGVLAAQAQAGQAKTALDLTAKVKDAAQQRFQTGDVAEIEVIQADVELARATADHETAVLQQRTAEVTLAALLNRPLETSLQVAGALHPLPPAPGLEGLIATALRSNADLLRASQELITEEKRLALAKAQRIPDVTIQAAADLNSPPSFRAALRGQVAVTVPLFYHGQGEVSLATARAEWLRIALRARQVSVAAQVAAAYYDHVAKANQVRQYEEKVLPQTVRLESMAEQSYRAGKTTLLTWIDAQRRLGDVRRAYVDSLFAAQRSFAALEEAEGVPLD